MKIIHERDKCIGCGVCAGVCPKYWEMTEDGKAKLIDSITNSKSGNYELEVKQVGCNQDAADVCPVNIIHIEK